MGGAALELGATQVPGRPTLGAILEHVFPASIIDAMARNDVLQVVVLRVPVPAPPGAAIGAKSLAGWVEFARGFSEVMFRSTQVCDVPGAARWARPIAVRSAPRASACCSAWVS